MKDFIITVKRKKIEIVTWLICFAIANLLNLYSIIAYNTKFIELITSIGYVVVFSIILYLLWSLIRLLFYCGKRLITRKHATNPKHL